MSLDEEPWWADTEEIMPEGFEVDFLPVGEGSRSGDAIALRYGNLGGSRADQMIVIIDGGFLETGKNLVEHVANYYDPNGYVDLIVSTHPDEDHCSGLRVVLDSFEVGQLWMHQPWSHSTDLVREGVSVKRLSRALSESAQRSLAASSDLQELANASGVEIVEPFTGVRDASGQLVVVGPTETFYEELLQEFDIAAPTASSTSMVGRAALAVRKQIQRVAENWNHETLSDDGETSPRNESSAILMLEAADRRLLFTADAGQRGLSVALDVLDGASIDPQDTDFVQVPHHGSKRNVGPALLDRLLGPRESQDVKKRRAYVSAASDGAPKHPARQVTNAFRRRGTHVYATQGSAIRYSENAPARQDWGPVDPLPFFEEVEV